MAKKKKTVKRPIKLAATTEFPADYPANIMKLPPNPDSLQVNNPNNSTDQDQGRPKTVVIHTERIGSTGTASFTGYPAEDYLTIVRGKHKAIVYDQMRRSDSQIKMCLNAVKNPIRSATWEFDPVDVDNPEEVEIAEFVDYVLKHCMEKSWDKFISEALTCVDFGHSVFEITNKLVTGDPKYGDFIGISDLGFRSPKTIERWNLDPKTDKLFSILQLAFGDTARNIEIPGNFLVVFSIDREGSNYEGISMLRCCYGPWFRKDLYLKLNAIGIEKFAIPTPVAEIPQGAQGTDQYDALIEALVGFTQHESQYLTYPEGWKVNLVTNVYDPQKVDHSVEMEDTRIIKGFLANFLNLGMTQSAAGSRSLGEDLREFFLAGIQFIADEIASEINLTLVPMIVMQNYGPRAKYPKCKSRGISDAVGQEFGNMMKALADAQYITPDDPLEDHLRKRLKLPDMSMTGQRKVQAKGAGGLGAGETPISEANAASDFSASLAERIMMAHARKLSKLTTKGKPK